MNNNNLLSYINKILFILAILVIISYPLFIYIGLMILLHIVGSLLSLITIISLLYYKENRIVKLILFSFYPIFLITGNSILIHY